MDQEQGADEIIEEVRRLREELLRSAGGSLEGLFSKIKDLESRESRQVVRLPARRAARVKPDAA